MPENKINEKPGWYWVCWVPRIILGSFASGYLALESSNYIFVQELAVKFWNIRDFTLGIGLAMVFLLSWLPFFRGISALLLSLVLAIIATGNSMTASPGPFLKFPVSIIVLCGLTFLVYDILLFRYNARIKQ
jgi:hypothetical protein